MGKLLRSLVTIVLLLVSAWYIYGLVSTQYEQIGDYLDRFTLSILAAALACHLVGGVMNAAVWHRLLNAHEVDARFLDSFRAWSVSRLLRYIPGKVFGFIGRIYYQQARDKAGVVAASFSEIIVSYLPILILALISVVFYWPYIADFATYFAAAAILAMFLLLAWPMLLKRFRKFALQLGVTTSLSGQLPNAAVALSCGGLSFLAMLVHGLGLFLLIDATHSIDIGWYFFIVSAFYISSVIGQMAVFVPAGIGVREASLAYFLSLIGVDQMAALVAVILSRLISVASELINAAAAQLARETRK